MFIEDIDGNILTHLGPIHHHGPGSLNHIIITSSLEKGQEYIARINAESVLGNTTSSHSFSKFNIVVHSQSTRYFDSYNQEYNNKGWVCPTVYAST